MPVQLAFEEFGCGPPLIVLHGLFGSSTNWRSIAKRLSADFRVLSLDLRNHGRSGWHDDMGYTVMAEDVHNFIFKNSLGTVTVLGHSMGGKTAMVLALKYGEFIDKLVIVDIAPVDYGHSYISLTESMLRLDLGHLANRTAADAALAQSIQDTPTRQFLLQNLISVDKKLEWRIHLASIQQNMDKLTRFPTELLDSLFDQATLFVHGSESDYVTPHHHPRINKLFPNNRIVTIEKAGHWVHIQRPDELLKEITTFIK